MGMTGKLVIDLLFGTTRIKSVGMEPVRQILSGRKFIFAFWHSRLLLVSYLYQGWGAAILVSGSEDGEIIARILQRQGHATIRGSSSRGGMRALARQIKLMREKEIPGGVVPDGPLGPRFKVQPGVITLAKKTGYPIVPVSYSAKTLKVFASWDRFILPCPFTECTIIYGAPVYVPREADRQKETCCQDILERELCRITSCVDESFGHQIE